MNRVIFITGTRKGIGEELAKYYIRQHDHVIGCSRTMPEWADDYSEDVYMHCLADVSNEAEVRDIFSIIKNTYGCLDVLINNAGIASMNHALLTPMSSVHKVLDTNVAGTFLCCREAAKLMRKKNKGRIVNFSTVAVPLNLAGEAVYAASKSAIVSLTHVLAKEFADFGITVNAIGPVPIKTDLIRGVSEEKINALIDQQAIKRFGTFEDIENVMDFFLSERSDFVTGQVVYLGGV